MAIKERRKMNRYHKPLLLTLSIIVSIFLLVISCAPSPPQVKPPPPPPPPEKPTPPEPEKPPPTPTFPITVTDDLGRKITIDKLPQRIVSLAPSNTEILFALGLENRIVGVTSYCNYPDAARKKPKIGGFYPPDIERVIAQKPDLVLAAKIHDKTVLPRLEKLGLTVLVLAPKTLDEILNNITLIGKISGKSQEANLLVTNLSQRIKAITTKTEKLPPEQYPRVLYVVWHDPIWTMGGDNFQDDVIRKAGGKNIFATDFPEWRIVSLEEVLTRNPQIIIVSGMGATRELIFSSIKNEPRLATTEAITKGRIYEIEGDLIERPGPRIVDALEQLAKLFHPEIFGTN